MKKMVAPFILFIGLFIFFTAILAIIVREKDFLLYAILIDLLLFITCIGTFVGLLVYRKKIKDFRSKWMAISFFFISLLGLFFLPSDIHAELKDWNAFHHKKHTIIEGKVTSVSTYHKRYKGYYISSFSVNHQDVKISKFDWKKEELTYGENVKVFILPNSKELIKIVKKK